MVARAHSSLHPNRYLDLFSRFCRAHERDQQTDTQTDHATPSVAIGRIYQLLWPKKQHILTDTAAKIWWRIWQISSLTIRDPVACHVEPESSVAPVEFFRNYFIHHRHIQVYGVVEKQRVDRTLYTQEFVNWRQTCSLPGDNRNPNLLINIKQKRSAHGTRKDLPNFTTPHSTPPTQLANLASSLINPSLFQTKFHVCHICRFRRIRPYLDSTTACITATAIIRPNLITVILFLQPAVSLKLPASNRFSLFKTLD